MILVAEARVDLILRKIPLASECMVILLQCQTPQLAILVDIPIPSKIQVHNLDWSPMINLLQSNCLDSLKFREL